jgi:hypothetical protein
LEGTQLTARGLRTRLACGHGQWRHTLGNRECMTDPGMKPGGAPAWGKKYGWPRPPAKAPALKSTGNSNPAAAAAAPSSSLQCGHIHKGCTHGWAPPDANDSKTNAAAQAVQQTTGADARTLPPQATHHMQSQPHSLPIAVHNHCKRSECVSVHTVQRGECGADAPRTPATLRPRSRRRRRRPPRVPRSPPPRRRCRLPAPPPSSLRARARLRPHTRSHG